MKKIIELLKNYRLVEALPVTLLRESSDNKVFLIGKKDKKILRISKRLPVKDIEFECQVIQLLLKAGMPVPKIVLTKNDDFYAVIDEKVAVVFDFLDGCHIQVDKEHLPTEKQAYNAGRCLGLMSNVASDFKIDFPRKRSIYSELERVLSLSNVFISRFEGGQKFIDEVKKAIDFGKRSNEIQGFIHNDYRPGNVFFNKKDGITGIIDFDWSCIGPVIKDLALAVVEWSFPDGLDKPDWKTFDAFLEGYNSSANNKVVKDSRIYSWIKFATLSDAATYFCDLAVEFDSTKKTIKSYMYRKYIFFSTL